MQFVFVLRKHIIGMQAAAQAAPCACAAVCSKRAIAFFAFEQELTIACQLHLLRVGDRGCGRTSCSTCATASACRHALAAERRCAAASAPHRPRTVGRLCSGTHTALRHCTSRVPSLARRPGACVRRSGRQSHVVRRHGCTKVELGQRRSKRVQPHANAHAGSNWHAWRELPTSPAAIRARATSARRR